MNLFKLLMTFCLGSFLQPTESYIFRRELATKETPNTIDQINIDSYLGYWYQIYGSPTNVIFQGYGKCITAEYGLLENDNISVLNSQVNLENELEQISGYAYYKNVSEPGKLTVHLDGTSVDAPYWIVLLGEEKDKQYQYSIVTSPSGVSLWVLVRDINVFLEYYDEEVREFLEEYNYKYVTIEHDDNCVYV
jgi:lipocalin